MGIRRMGIRVVSGIVMGAACFAAPGAYAGQIASEHFASAALGRELPVLVYTPSGDAPAQGWPVLYLLHGHGGDETSWRDLGDIGPTLDEMIGSGAIRPQLVVMPGVGDSWYVDSASVGGPGNYETALTRDLPAAVEERYPVRRDRGGRAIAGLSMGGFGALRLSLAHPDSFIASVALSPGMWQNIPADELDLAPEAMSVIGKSQYFHRNSVDDVTEGVDIPPAPPYFGASFGQPFDGRLFNRLNVFTLLEDAIIADVPLPAMYVTVGDDDSHALWRGAIAFFETMKADDRPVEFRVTDGDHVWLLWSQTIRDGLTFIEGHWTDLPAARPSHGETAAE
ncbi:alpha/beta hydrolase [Aureimonas frigidaquae]|uniref:Esterase/lipase n=1 Tax=Aureimonas frigidaquae TaxID=424757 RepID=A0A0P0Z4C1_9HYPH|nr:alpha/beta hydrolase family protein [Aureimonas frigidaquae]BAT28778.1 esterase/lipase [Aureimonas frigidaquae]